MRRVEHRGLAVLDAVVVRDELLVDEVEGIETDAVVLDTECLGDRPDRQTLQVWHKHLDNEVPARTQMPGGIAEARDLLGLGQEIGYGVVDQIHEVERTGHGVVRHIAHDQRDPLAAWLRAKHLAHCLRTIDAGNRQASGAERQRDTSCADGEFQGLPAWGKSSQEIHRRLQHLRRVHVGGRLVVVGRELVPQLRGHHRIYRMPDNLAGSPINPLAML